MSLKLLHETESDDPILSVVNIIDIFLVIIAALLITVAQNPMLNAFSKQDVTVITDAGKRLSATSPAARSARVRAPKPAPPTA
jgi:hypothetical protein